MKFIIVLYFNFIFPIQRLVYNKCIYNKCPLHVSLSFAMPLNSLQEVPPASFIIWLMYFVLDLPLDRVPSSIPYIKVKFQLLNCVIYQHVSTCALTSAIFFSLDDLSMFVFFFYCLQDILICSSFSPTSYLYLSPTPAHF